VERGSEWAELFSTAFTQSRNAMVLLDGTRRIVDVNGAYERLLRYPREDIVDQPMRHFLVDGPLVSPGEWKEALEEGRFAGDAEMQAADGSIVAVQWAATTEIVTGRQLVLIVALSTSRWRPRLQRSTPAGHEPEALSKREREIVRLVALGNTGPEIADQLQIAHDTVRTHARNAMAKTGAHSRAHLVAKALGEALALE
jgi:PAS domain S-box-containing protein